MRDSLPNGGGALGTGDNEDLVPFAVATKDTEPLRVAESRRIWWEQAKLGNRLPAEPGIILLLGGRP